MASIAGPPGKKWELLTLVIKHRKDGRAKLDVDRRPEKIPNLT
jgi:hypothetical protein